MPGILVGCDVGGTFTDAVALDPETREHATAKAPTTPHDRSQGAADAIDRALTTLGRRPAEVARVLHGTTTATNALLERDLARTALVTHRGMEDLLEIGRQDRPSLYDLQVTRPPPLVDRSDRHGITGRLDARGHEVTPVDDNEIEALAERMADQGVEAVAVCLLHSYRDPGHERRVAGTLADRLDDGITVATSHGVSPEVREVERFTTTVLNAALTPRMEAYLGRLADTLASIGIRAPVHVLDSAGALMGLDEAARLPVRTLLSGPAGGAAGCQLLATELEIPDLLGVDMGGTSTDVTLLLDGRPTERWEAEIAGQRLQTPAADIHTVGAGGGSIAWVDEAGGLRVGPASAGADPGPACYGRGGQQATVTDAHLLLGRLPADTPLGGTLDLDPDAARTAIGDLATQLDADPAATAHDILQIALAQAARGIRTLTARHAADPGTLTLLAFGGAGPMLGCALATELGIDQVVVPSAAGVHSAVGLLAAPPRIERARSLVCPLEDDTLPVLRDTLGALDDEATAALGRPEATVEHRASLRYQGQSHTLTIELPELDTAAIRQAFETAHEARFGHRLPETPVEVVTVRSRARAPAALTPATVQAPDPQDGPHPSGETQATFLHGAEQAHATRVIDLSDLEPGHRLTGPAILPGRLATTVVPPGWHLTVLDAGHLKLEQGEVA